MSATPNATNDAQARRPHPSIRAAVRGMENVERLEGFTNSNATRVVFKHGSCVHTGRMARAVGVSADNFVTGTTPEGKLFFAVFHHDLPANSN